MLKRVAIQTDAAEGGGQTSFPSLESVCLIDAEGRLIAADEEAGRWLPKPLDGHRETPFLKFNELVSEELATTWIGQLIEPGASGRIEATLRIEGEPTALIDIELRRLDGLDGPLVLATFRRSVAEGLLFRDAVTGLPDRRAIGPCIASWQREAIEPAVPFAVLFLDLNDFKQVNDLHGHAAGDQVLAEIADRWSSTVRDGDLVTRYGGDEFVVLLKNVADREGAALIVERLRIATLKPITVGGTSITLSAAIGVAVSDGVDAPIEQLIAAADEDMYARKRRRPK